MVTASSNTAAAIFEAASRLMLEQGEGGLRVDAVAAAAGCNKRLIYHYFGSRDGLVAAVYQQQCRVLCSQGNGLSDHTRDFLYQQLQHLWPEFEPSLDPDGADLQQALKSALVLVVPSLMRAVAGVNTDPRETDFSIGEWQKVSAEMIAVLFDSEESVAADRATKVSERSQTFSKPRYRMASASRVVD